MAIAPPDLHTVKFLNALDEFMESSPLLPDGASDQLKAIGQHLRGYDQADLSPGQKAVKQAQQPTDGTGAPYAQAATGQDLPSPGQREFEQAVSQMRDAVGIPAPSNN